MTHNSLSNNSIDKVQGIYHINRKGRYPRGNKNTTPMTGIAPEPYCYSSLTNAVSSVSPSRTVSNNIMFLAIHSYLRAFTTNGVLFTLANLWAGSHPRLPSSFMFFMHELHTYAHENNHKED
jgi:hypothetical protein